MKLFEPDLGDRCMDHLLGEVDSAHPRLRELASQEQRAGAGAAADVKDPLRGGGDVEDGRRERLEVLDPAGAGAVVPTNSQLGEVPTHRASEERP